jgi:spoIIIJ-associated protein
METSHQEAVTGIINDLMQKMGFAASVEVRPLASSETILFAITVEGDQNLLIGQHGANLAALQHLVRALARQKTSERLDITVDVNNYFAEKAEILIKEADKAVTEALESRISVALRPMLPYERKIVHSHLSKHDGVTTESIGNGADRKVLIRPKASTDETVLENEI